MKKLLILAILFAGCKKNDPKPEIEQPIQEQPKIEINKLNIEGDSAWYLFKGKVFKANSNDTLNLYKGDSIEIKDNSEYVKIKITLNNNVIYEKECYCKAYYKLKI